MRAMLLKKIGPIAEGHTSLEWSDIPEPVAGNGEVLLKVSVCGVCHTEMDEIEGRTPPEVLPVVLGHQVVGVVEVLGDGVSSVAIGDRVGVAWIYSACGDCVYCRRGEENLCPDFKATGRDVNGGYAEKMVVPASFIYPVPDGLSDEHAAPLLCAGAIGYRSLMLTGLSNGQRLGLTGFGASGHLVLKLVQHMYPDSEVYVFARDKGEQAFALELGAVWAGGSRDKAPELLHAIIDTTPAWGPIVGALENMEPGGRLVVNAIRKEGADKSVLQEIDYPDHLWMEKEIKSVANITRKDVREFLELAAEIPIEPEYQVYDLADANEALVDMRCKGVRGAKVLRVG